MTPTPLLVTVPPEPPATLAVRPGGIPRELTERPQWVCWRFFRKQDSTRWDKLPLNPLTRAAAKSDTPSTWGTFDVALSAYQGGGLDGIGYVIGDEEPFTVVDLDGVRDPASGVLLPWAAGLVDRLGTFNDVSPSGRGVHLVVRGKLPPGRRQRKNWPGGGAVEAYDFRRFFSVTGHPLNEESDPPPIVDASGGLLAQVHLEYLQRPAWALARRPAPEPTPPATPTPAAGDDEVLARIRRSDVGEKFNRLWDGDWQSHGSRSEADLALCNYLRFWCGPDAARVDSLFRQSGLMRAKWDSPRGESTYGARTVAKALEVREYAEPGRGGPRVTIGPADPVIVRASAVRPRPVEWLWPGRIPLAKLTTFAGPGGLGKTFVLLDVAARVSRGLPWPQDDGSCAPTGSVLFISGEDEPDDTLVPRLIELGADLNRVAFLTSKALGAFTLNDSNLELLRKAIRQVGKDLKVIVIDPPTAYLGGVNDHKNSELRQLLTPLKELAARRRLALVFNTHFTKPAGHKVEAAMRIMGSVAWSNAVRSTHVFVRDPHDPGRVLFCPVKVNLGRLHRGLAYRIEETETLARVAWLGEVDVTAEEAVNPQPHERRDSEASDWLIERFQERREWSSAELFQAAREHGISRSAIFEAKRLICLPKARKRTLPNGDEAWYWWVPPDWSHLSRPPTNGSLETDESDDVQ
jgi:putative DNA primase/helicase